MKGGKYEIRKKYFKIKKRLKLSQEQLAEKVDVTRQTISNWELGETSPNPEQLKLLSKTLIVTLCGSLKFQKEMMTVAEKLALEGYCILTPIYSVSEKIEITKNQLIKH